jgi:hypothetical protein
MHVLYQSLHGTSAVHAYLDSALPTDHHPFTGPLNFTVQIHVITPTASLRQNKNKLTKRKETHVAATSGRWACRPV